MNKVKSITESGMRPPVTDAHLDLAFDLEKQRAYGKRAVLNRDYLPFFQAGGLTLVVSSIFVENLFVPEMALRMALRQIAALKADIADCADHFSFCVTHRDVEEANRQGKIAVMLSFEDCIPLYQDLSILPLFYELGVRFMGLSWSRRNFACDGSSLGPKEWGTPGGLTGFGIALVRRCRELGMLLDVSHLSPAGFADVLRYTDGPRIASHSNARAIVDTERNLSDDQIRLIAERKGFIGVNAMNFITSPEGMPENAAALAKHVAHIASIGGVECVGFGFDLNDQILKYIPQDELDIVPRKCGDVLHTHAELPLLIEELDRAGFNEKEQSLIAGENYMRLLRENLD